MLYDSLDPAGVFEVMNSGKTTGTIYVSAEATLLPDHGRDAAVLIPQQAS